MSGKIIYFDQCQDDLVGGIEWLLEEARAGRLISLVGVGMMEIKNNPNVNIATVRAGAWGANMYTTVGGLEAMKTRLLVSCDERLKEELVRQWLEPTS